MSNDDSASGLSCYCGACCGVAVGLAIGHALWHSSPQPTIGEMLKDDKVLTASIERENGDTLTRSIKRYQTEIRPILNERIGSENICRYQPSCSDYALQAIESNGRVIGSIRAIMRIARCNPISKGGYDPV